MIPVWPADLPQRFRAADSSFGFGDGRLRTPMDAGPPKVRRRFSAVVKPVTLSWRGSEDDVARFERFFEEEIAGGSLPFFLPDPRRDGRPLLTDDGVVLLDDQGRPLLNTAWWLCLFGETVPTQIPVTGLLMQVNMQLAVLP
ncbi:hypothetical protein [Methylobacterium isbiliense]|jgi:hypothetical protein|uniref:Uncharacterized protein n=1 Tax=Methylobacterium isbiliense TaxID=315478 RepID=A0ABQ4SDR6_9HYPH|nr:hypothetical protein [Methylobacterium isbiliense]MDN3622611.1 hypothetical protein [Methylobacterium isbiliense]GJE00541.1 hypothetical protein GMJLKIPL_2464 [Methylobacterium isbiliense]